MEYLIMWFLPRGELFEGDFILRAFDFLQWTQIRTAITTLQAR